MSDSFTQTNKISYGSNIKNSFTGALLGLILFVASFFVLWKNEGHNVEQIAKANYANQNAVVASVDKADRNNDNKLVQLSGKAQTDAVLTDGIVSLPKAFALKRNVEMYQWDEQVKTEKKDEIGGGTTETKTYKYVKVWSDMEIDSQDFAKSGYTNPPFPVKSTELYAQSGTFGDFKLTEFQSKRMSGLSEYDALPQKTEYKIFDNKYYKSSDPQNPAIGDIRISYEYVPSGIDISIIGQQKPDNTIAAMPFKNSSVYIQQSGFKTKEEMITAFRQNNKFITNVFRFVGWLLMFFGLNLLISPLVVIFKFLPFIEQVVGFLSTGVLFIISVLLSLLVISLAWLAYRPFLFVALLLAVFGVIYMLKSRVTRESGDK